MSRGDVSLIRPSFKDDSKSNPLESSYGTQNSPSSRNRSSNGSRSLSENGRLLKTHNSSTQHRARSLGPEKRHSFDKDDPCVCGPNLYGNVLGPTVDEPILLGLTTFLKMCDECPERDILFKDKPISSYASRDSGYSSIKSGTASGDQSYSPAGTSTEPGSYYSGTETASSLRSGTETGSSLYSDTATGSSLNTGTVTGSSLSSGTETASRSYSERISHSDAVSGSTNSSRFTKKSVSTASQSVGSSTRSDSTSASSDYSRSRTATGIEYSGTKTDEYSKSRTQGLKKQEGSIISDTVYTSSVASGGSQSFSQGLDDVFKDSSRITALELGDDTTTIISGEQSTNGVSVPECLPKPQSKTSRIKEQTISSHPEFEILKMRSISTEVRSGSSGSSGSRSVSFSTKLSKSERNLKTNSQNSPGFSVEASVIDSEKTNDSGSSVPLPECLQAPQACSTPKSSVSHHTDTSIDGIDEIMPTHLSDATQTPFARIEKVVNTVEYTQVPSLEGTFKVERSEDTHHHKHENSQHHNSSHHEPNHPETSHHPKSSHHGILDHEPTHHKTPHHHERNYESSHPLTLPHHEANNHGTSRHEPNHHVTSHHESSHHDTLPRHESSHHMTSHHEPSHHATSHHEPRHHGTTHHYEPSHYGTSHSKPSHLGTSHNEPSHHKTSHHLLSHHGNSLHETSYYGTSHHQPSHHGTSHHVLSNHETSHYEPSDHGTSHYEPIHHRASQHLLSHRGTSHHELGQHGTSHHVPSNHGTSHSEPSHHGTSHHEPSHYGISQHLLSHHGTSHHEPSHHGTSHHLLSHHATSYQEPSHHKASHHEASYQGTSHHEPLAHSTLFNEKSIHYSVPVSHQSTTTDGKRQSFLQGPVFHPTISREEIKNKCLGDITCTCCVCNGERCTHKHNKNALLLSGFTQTDNNRSAEQFLQKIEPTHGSIRSKTSHHTKKSDHTAYHDHGSIHSKASHHSSHHASKHHMSRHNYHHSPSHYDTDSKASQHEQNGHHVSESHTHHKSSDSEENPNYDPSECKCVPDQKSRHRKHDGKSKHLKSGASKHYKQHKSRKELSSESPYTHESDHHHKPVCECKKGHSCRCCSCNSIGSNSSSAHFKHDKKSHYDSSSHRSKHLLYPDHSDIHRKSHLNISSQHSPSGHSDHHKKSHNTTYYSTSGQTDHGTSHHDNLLTHQPAHHEHHQTSTHHSQTERHAHSGGHSATGDDKNCHTHGPQPHCDCCMCKQIYDQMVADHKAKHPHHETQHRHLELHHGTSTHGVSQLEGFRHHTDVAQQQSNHLHSARHADASYLTSTHGVTDAEGFHHPFGSPQHQSSHLHSSHYVDASHPSQHGIPYHQNPTFHNQTTLPHHIPHYGNPQLPGQLSHHGNPHHSFTHPKEHYSHKHHHHSTTGCLTQQYLIDHGISMAKQNTLSSAEQQSFAFDKSGMHDDTAGVSSMAKQKTLANAQQQSFPLNESGMNDNTAGVSSMAKQNTLTNAQQSFSFDKSGMNNENVLTNCICSKPNALSSAHFRTCRCDACIDAEIERLQDLKQSQPNCASVINSINKNIIASCSKKPASKKKSRKICLCSDPPSTMESCTPCLDVSLENVAKFEKADCNVPDVKYAITKISKFTNFTTFELMKSTSKKPKVCPGQIEGVFVLKNKKNC